MSPSKISVLKCEEYDPEKLESLIVRSLANIGFDPASFGGKRVALKPNLLIPADVQKAVMTHPEFFRAMVRVVKANGGSPVLIESPSIHSLARTLKRTPYQEVVDSEAVDVADVDLTRTLHFEDAKKFKHIDIAAAFFDADIIVNLPKFKTHGLTYITGAVKNLFGSIPGLQKSKMHVKLPSAPEFCEFLVDLYGAILNGFDSPKEVIHVMDAIVAMEGEGPGPSGTPKPMNAVLAGRDAVAMDYVATKIAGLEVEKAFTVNYGFERDFGVNGPDDIEVVGDSISSLGNTPLEASRGTIMSNMVRWPFTAKWFKNLTIERPWPREGICTLCYQCKKICPAGAISASTGGKKIPTYNYDLCIRCYCCMEVCPEAAITKKRGKLQWLSRL